MEVKEKRTKVAVVMLALACLLLVWSPATAGNLEPSGPPGPTMKSLDEVESRIPIRASDLPLTISEPNSYYFTEDINFEPNDTNAITIECNDVTIDLKGYTLKGPDSGLKSGIYMNGRDNVEIRNGTIRDFGWPAILEYGSGRNHRAINIRALSSGWGIYLLGSGHLIKDCTVSANTNNGIYTGQGDTVTGNTCCYNGGNGILTGSYCTVAGNTCYSNSNDGIGTLNGSKIIGNMAGNNTNNGINAGDYCLLAQNTAYGNGTNLVKGTECVLGTNCAP